MGCFCLLLAFSVSGQDENLFNHYFATKAFYNPAFNGFSGKHELKLVTKSDWSGFPGSPKTYGANYNGPLSQNIGIGVNLFTENIASFNRYRAGFNYSFRFEQGDLKTSIGLNTSFEHYRVSDPTAGNALYDNGDNTISEFANGESFFDASLGIYLSYFNYYLGITSPNLIQSRIDDLSLTENDGSVFRHYSALFGALYEFGSSGVSLEPMLFFRKARNIPMAFSGTMLVGFLEEKVKAGFSYSNAVEGSLSMIAGSKFDNFSLYYSYNISLGKFQQYGRGNHELTLGVSFDSRRSRFRNAY